MQIAGTPLRGTLSSGRDGFLKGSTELIGVSLRFLDLTIITVGAICAHRIHIDGFSLLPQYKTALFVALFASMAIFPLFNLYKPWRGMSIELEVRTALIAWLAVSLLLPFIVYIAKAGEEYSRLWYIYWITITSLLLILSRFVIRKIAQWARSNGLNTSYIVIVGSGELAQIVRENLSNNPWTGIQVVGFYDHCPEKSESGSSDSQAAPYLGSTSRLVSVLKNQNGVSEVRRPNKIDSFPRIDQVWVALSLSEQKYVREVCDLLDDTAVSVVLVPDIFLGNLLNHSVDNLAGMSVVNLRTSPMIGISSVAKMLEDIIVSTLALILFLIPMLIIALAIKLESKGPILFKQRRYGIDGKEIEVWKFRSMAVMEDGGTVIQAKRNDSRVTKVGAFLRKTSLDELPQFINVLQGRMSVVGPRPHAIAHNEKYRKEISNYMWRCKVKPGITGWAQVNGWRGETDTPEKMENRVEYDLEYLKRWSIWFDMKIIFRTIFCVFKSKDVY